jgi:CheY-like chemotaxis protein
MPNGGLIQITTSRVATSAVAADTLPAGEYVQLAVSDSGVGIDAATRARMFEPFFTTKGPRGTGLGLATVYGIVKQSGGDIRCESAVNRGARFEVLLPRAAGELTATEGPRQTPPTRGTERVLVIEDEPAVRSFIASTLSRHGYDVRTADDGVDALEVLRQTPDIALVISDVRMPRMSGLAFYAHLRRTHPGVPTILISGDSAPDVTPTDGSEPPLFLQKPFSITALLTMARDALSRARAGP